MGPVVIHARIDDGNLVAGAGPLPDADLVIETGPALKAVMAREIMASEALAQGLVHITGDPALFDRFAQMFRI
jgi:hypothetical protein